MWAERIEFYHKIFITDIKIDLSMDEAFVCLPFITDKNISSHFSQLNCYTPPVTFKSEKNVNIVCHMPVRRYLNKPGMKLLNSFSEVNVRINSVNLKTPCWLSSSRSHPITHRKWNLQQEIDPIKIPDAFSMKQSITINGRQMYIIMQYLDCFRDLSESYALFSHI